jgi:outer membrane biosynthesis protein TonB
MLSKFAGIAAGPAKNLLSLLAPFILSIIAKQFSGKALTSQAMSNFFTEQRGNIASALPAGLSFADIPGLGTTHATTAPQTTAPQPVSAPATEEGSGLPGWLLPLVGLALLALLGWYFMSSQQPVEQKPAAKPEVARNIPAPEPKPAAPESKPAMTETKPVMTETKPPVPETKPVVTETRLEVPAVDVSVTDPARISTDLSGIYTSLKDVLAGIKDGPTSEAAVPRLTDMIPRIDSLQALWDKLPDVGKATVAKVTTDHLAKLKGLIAGVLNTMGVNVDKLKPVLDTIVGKLTSFAIDPARISTDLSGIYTSLKDVLASVKDGPTSEAAVYRLTDMMPRIDSLQALWNGLPGAGKPTVAKVTTDHLAKLKDLIASVLSTAGVNVDRLKPVLDTIVDKLAAFTIQ